MMSKKIVIHFAPVDSWTLRYCSVDEDFMNVLQLTEEDRYRPTVYENVFSIDSDMILVVAETLNKAIHIAILAMLDHFQYRYEDGVREGYEDMSVNYATWLMPLLNDMAEIANNPVETDLQDLFDE